MSIKARLCGSPEIALAIRKRFLILMNLHMLPHRGHQMELHVTQWTAFLFFSGGLDAVHVLLQAVTGFCTIVTATDASMKRFGTVVNSFTMPRNVLRIFHPVTAIRYWALERPLFRMAPHVAVNIVLPFATVIAKFALKLPRSFIQMNHGVPL